MIPKDRKSHRSDQVRNIWTYKTSCQGYLFSPAISLLSFNISFTLYLALWPSCHLLSLTPFPFTYVFLSLCLQITAYLIQLSRQQEVSNFFWSWSLFSLCIYHLFFHGLVSTMFCSLSAWPDDQTQEMASLQGTSG